MVANAKIDIEMVKKALAENPEILQAALATAVTKGTGLPKYKLLKKETKELPIAEMEGTKIVKKKTRSVVFYTYEMPNGSIVSVPEYALEDYGLRADGNAPCVDQDGLTDKDKSNILNNGAF